jgi:carbamoyl-phosphate synthase large subunit
VIGGESQVTTAFREPALEGEAAQILEELRLRGPVVMQAILTPDGLQIIEVNPRFGGASTLAIAAGLDILYWSLLDATCASARPEFRPFSGQLRQVRLPGDIVLHDPDL